MDKQIIQSINERLTPEVILEIAEKSNDVFSTFSEGILKFVKGEVHPLTYLLFSKQLEMFSLSRCSNVLVQLGKLSLAKQLLNWVKNESYKKNNLIGAAECYMGIGEIALEEGDLKNALHNYEKAFKYFDECNDYIGIVKSYMNFGKIELRKGNFQTALDIFDKAIQINKENENNPIFEIQILFQKGIIYFQYGEFQKGIEIFKYVRDVNKKFEGKHFQYQEFEGMCLTNIGIAYRSLGLSEQAIYHLNKARKVYEENLDIKNQALVISHLASVHMSLENQQNDEDNIDKAIEYLHEALGMDESTNHPSTYFAGLCYSRLSICHYKKEKEKVLEYHNKAVDMFKLSGNKFEEINCYVNIPKYYNELGKYEESIKELNRALEMAEKEGYKTLLKTLYYNLAVIYAEQKSDLLSAFKYLANAINLADNLLENIISDDIQKSYSSQNNEIYEYMTYVCIRLEKYEEAFMFLEKGKSRSLMELLKLHEFRPNLEDNTDYILIKEGEELIEKIRRIKNSYKNNTQLQEKGNVDLSILVRKLNEIYDKIKKNNPEYVSLRTAKTITAVKVMNSINNMRSNKSHVALIEYFIYDNYVYFFIFSTRNSGLQFQSKLISKKEIKNMFENYVLDITDHVNGYSIDGSLFDNWSMLSEYFTEPLSDFIFKDDIVYLVPYSYLNFLPLHALKLNKTHKLIISNPICYLSSSSILPFLLNKNNTEKVKSCVAFGLSYANDEEVNSSIESIFQAEAELVANTFNVKEIFKGKEVTKELVLSKLLDFDVIHFSCHGFFNYTEPILSGVKLYDEIFSVKDIFNTKIRCNLLTLSACDTGISHLSKGDEIMGLERAFLYAGVPSICFSIWSADSLTTKELMTTFYKNLQNGDTKSVALQKSQLSLMSIEEWKHPYYWAPFVLKGLYK